MPSGVVAIAGPRQVILETHFSFRDGETTPARTADSHALTRRTDRDFGHHRPLMQSAHVTSGPVNSDAETLHPAVTALRISHFAFRISHFDVGLHKVITISSARLTDLSDRSVAIAGDWHINEAWVREIIPRISACDPTIRTILHAGDFGVWPGAKGESFLSVVDEVCAEFGIDRVLVTPGNHEYWSKLEERFAERPGEVVRLSDVVRVMPRGYRFTIGGVRFLSFGGAASLDRYRRIEGETWWPGEMPTDEDVETAIADGATDVLITHDMVDRAIPALDHRILRYEGWPPDALARSAMSRNRVTRVWAAVQPRILFHGHMHTAAVSPAAGPRVVSLSRDNSRGNIVILTLPGLSVEWLPE